MDIDLYAIGLMVLFSILLLALTALLVRKNRNNRFDRFNKTKTEDMPKADFSAARSPLEIIFGGDAYTAQEKEEAAKKYAAICDEREKRDAEHRKQVLEKWELAGEDIEKIKKQANERNYKDGVYRCNQNAQFGSVDNPEIVGIPEYSNNLQFSFEREHWILTDGFGNGWIR